MKLPEAAVFDAHRGFLGDWASQDGFQAALRQPESVLGLIGEVLCGVAVAWHRRAGEEMEQDPALRCFEEGSAPRFVARELTGASVDSSGTAGPY